MWPGIITEAFQLALPDGRHNESRFYGPYNLLLNHLFPVDEGYMIVPQYKRREDSKSIDFEAIFIVSHHEHPIFFVEVKPSGHTSNILPRRSADKQMRKRFLDLLDCLEVPILYGVSALGSKVCYYTYDEGTRRISPKVIKNDQNLVIDTTPADRWSLDIMTPDGEKKLREVVNHVKAMCAQL